MMQLAFSQWNKKQQPYHVYFRDLYGGLGLFTTRDLKKGDLVMTEEEKSKYLVSKKYADKNFKGLLYDWWINYAYPVSEELYAIWSDNPEDWKPINHSCNPSMWYEEGEMNLVAARDLKKGEELTMDYVTFLIDMDLSFDCACGE